ncbi:DUF2087 domain-containing protein [Spirilliplanes yamanashiensis]|uniref:DUF2087 domain-containing protein n=1 Tax=Spirilliplanes yamanashiensis TaxID=42233 RepID=A0A8J3Y5F5_9ACTN|nr:DUF2087 domain-containing protein [Spirilliplanes yamanashiensis]MDP9819384.1 hypothetical protein [Spirilliplanes yamanashiensis]GIJ01792.1 hypothetical protein Sya03_11440 [Spirilliplanes yamanashiensis]
MTGGDDLRPFVHDGRLRSLPARQARRRAVLEHVAASFEPGAVYPERVVNEVLAAWCDGGEADHVAVRRYLVDGGLLARSGGLYARDAALLPGPDAAQRHVRAMGLD